MPTFAAEAAGGLSQTGRLLWLGLMHSLWVGLLAASTAALVLQCGPRLSHRSRHSILAAAMLVAAVGPIALALWQHLGPCPADETATRGTASNFVVQTDRPSVRTPEPAAAAAGRVAWAASRASVGGRLMTPLLGAVSKARPIALAAWSLAASVLGASLIVGAIGLRRLCRGAEPAPGPLRDRSRRLSRLLRLREVPRLLVHTRLAEPFLCGVFSPTILLPKRWVVVASSRAVDAILAHEMAHARRRDQVVNLAQRVVEVGLFFHPAVHWLSRSLRRERELCADALAVRLTGDPLALAEALQSVARLRLEPPRIPAVGASLGGPSASLLPRIQELIGMTPSSPRFAVWPLASMPVAGVLALIAVAAGFADDRPSAPAAPTRAADQYGVPAAANRPAANHRRVVASMTLEAERSYERLSVSVAETRDDDRQISYAVRYIAGDASSWRKRLLDRVKLIQQDADVTAWTLDDKALFDLLAQVQQDARTNILQAPKVTSFNGAPATIINRKKQHYVAGFDAVEAGPPGFRPIVKTLDIGNTLDVTGSIRPDGTRLSVEMSDSWLVALRTMHHERRVGEEIHAAEYQVPTVTDRKYRLNCRLPEGSHLLISLGLYDRPRDLHGLAAVANDVLASVGVGRIEPQPDTFERLVVITPKPIILEPEERVGRPAPHADASAPAR